MDLIELVDSALLTEYEKEQCLSYVPPRSEEVLDSKSKYKLTRAIMHKGAVSGLLLATLNPLNGYGDIVSLALEERIRSAGAYASILEQLEAILLNKGLHLMTMLCSSSDELLREAMDRSGWEKGSRWTLALEFEAAAFHPYWYERHYTLPAGFRIFPLKEATAEQERQIEFHMMQYGVNAYLSPFLYWDHLQPINSLGLMEGEWVAGWIATHTFPEKPDYIQYSTIYVKPDLRSKGIAIQLLIESIRRHKASRMARASFEIGFQQSDSRWVKFVEKRLILYSDKQIYHLRRNKILNYNFLKKI